DYYCDSWDSSGIHLF
nr:immunoglobulin light chain junction region [Macaca mulatta]MOY05605.1 immunoglobulin light chain junction region [Macaca mulatta]MOY05936.1 immunoglobulin light chain junction region [Macaca mulatta]MOY07493.1 immunoglobulin light chain junction region [Macaca mulatta]MOY07635.1 immunoglobulin light chain junction region [Macaca mulatta]